MMRSRFASHSQEGALWRLPTVLECTCISSSCNLLYCNSFTGEDVVELHVHGSIAVVSGIMEALSHIPVRGYLCF